MAVEDIPDAEDGECICIINIDQCVVLPEKTLLC